MKNLASRLKIVRGKRSAKEFAALMGCSMQTIYRYEWGDRVPDERFLQELAERTGTSLDWLKGDASDHIIPEENTSPPKASPSAKQYRMELEARLEKTELRLESLESERRELAAENRRLYQEKEDVLRENGLLREKIARLEGELGRGPSHFDEHRNTRPSENGPLRPRV